MRTVFNYCSKKGWMTTLLTFCLTPLLAQQPDQGAVMLLDDAKVENLQTLQEETYIFPSSLTDGWHISVHAGVLQSWGSYTGDTDFWNKTNPAIGVSVGKYLTPVNDFRLQFMFGRNTGVYGANEVNQWGHHVPNWHFYSMSLGAQYLPNLTNLFCGYDEKRHFSMSAMAGISLVRTFGYANDNAETKASLDSMSVWGESPANGVPRTLVGLQVGLLSEYKLNDRMRLSLELSCDFMDDIYDGRLSSRVWDGHVNLLAGVTWQLWDKKSMNARLRSRSRLPEIEEIDEVIYKKSNDTIPEIEEKVVRKKLTYTLVCINENEVNVPSEQQVNVYTTATLWKTFTTRGEKTMVFVSNNSKEDNELFKSRAWTVCELLSNRWQVNQNDIQVIADDSMIKEMQFDGYDNFIVLVINENVKKNRK